MYDGIQLSLTSIDINNSKFFRHPLSVSFLLHHAFIWIISRIFNISDSEWGMQSSWYHFLTVHSLWTRPSDESHKEKEKTKLYINCENPFSSILCITDAQTDGRTHRSTDQETHPHMYLQAAVENRRIDWRTDRCIDVTTHLFLHC